LARACLAATLAGIVLVAHEAAATSALGRGLRIVDANYLFVDELDATRLLSDAMQFVESRIPELRVDTLGDRSYLLAAGPCVLRIEAPPGVSVPGLEPVLADVSAFLEQCLDELPEHLTSTDSLLLSAVLSSLDPYSTVFDEERKTEHTIQFRGKLAGIGARIGIRDEHLTLISVYRDSPAYRAGLRDGDIVQRVDGMSTINLPVSDAVQHIRGDVGTPVRLTVERAGLAAPTTFTVIRDLVTIPSVTTKRLPSGVVYASISHFSQTTPEDFRSRVAEAIGDDPAAGVIIDLRENSGGSMLGSSAIGDLFLDEGLLITTAGRKGNNVSGLTAEIQATSDTPFADLPVAILTSPRTASGSELLAASLRNHDRTILIGERTFGKGTVQKTYALTQDSSLKLTVGHFLPNGLSIPGGGMLPDVEIRTMRLGENTAYLPFEREQDELPFWLRTPAWLESSSVHPTAIVDLVDEAPAGATLPSEDAEDDEADLSADATVEFASQLLAQFGSTSAHQTLASARTWLDAQEQKADLGVGKAMQERGVDWQRPGSLSALRSIVDASLRVTIEPAGTSMRAGQESSLIVSVTNEGKAPLYRLYGTILSEARFLNGSGLLFGYVAPNATVRREITVKPPKGIRASRIDARVAFHNDYGLSISSAPMYLAVEPAPRPVLAWRARVKPASAPGELTIQVEIENRGDGDATDLRVFLKHPDSNTVELTDASHTIDLLAAGQKETVELGLKLLESVEATPEVDLVIGEPSFGIFMDLDVAAVVDGALDHWHVPPQIRLSAIESPDLGDGAYTLIAEITDEGGVTSVWSLVEGKQIEFFSAADRPRSLVHIALPWQPDTGIERIELIATDTDGLSSRYVAQL